MAENNENEESSKNDKNLIFLLDERLTEYFSDSVSQLNLTKSQKSQLISLLNEEEIDHNDIIKLLNTWEEDSIDD